MDSFGSFVRDKRKEKDMSLREMAVKLGYSATFWSDVENKKRNPPDIEKLEQVAVILNLSELERSLLFDLAGQAENIAPPDLTEYILETKAVRRALRVAKSKATEEDWDKFTDLLDKK